MKLYGRGGPGDVERSRSARPWARSLWLFGLAGVLAGCARGVPEAELDELRLPSGAVLSPEGAWLFVANSNLDLARTSSAIVVVDLGAFASALATGAQDSGCGPGVAPGGAEREIVECEPSVFLESAAGIRVPSGAKNMALDVLTTDEGRWRLLVPTTLDEVDLEAPDGESLVVRGDVTWIDVTRELGEIRMRCDEGPGGVCGTAHRLTSVARSDVYKDELPVAFPPDPSRITIDTEGFRFAYLPHLRGNVITLIALDHEVGPEIVQVRKDIFGSTANQLYGAFAAAVRPCGEPAPLLTQECSRPLIYVTHRFWPGLRMVSVSPGNEKLVAFEEGLQNSIRLPGFDPAVAEDRPILGDLTFEDTSGDRLLVVATTPPALLRVDTSLDEGGAPKNTLQGTVSLCTNPNLVALVGGEVTEGEALALVSCYSEARVAAVSLGSFAVAEMIEVDAGPNELVVDATRKRLYVVHTLASTIGVVELDRRSPDYLRMVARLGTRR